MTWKVVAESVIGTRHWRDGLPCQDACRARQVGSTLLLSCADGAGSASLAEVGAERACAVLLDVIADDLAEGLPLDGISRDTSLYWLAAVRVALGQEAERRGVHPRELSCTLLLAIVGEQTACFGQIGDGAIVRATPEGWPVVFWPDGGEYANETHFVTADDAEDHWQFAVLSERIDTLALLSDGLQRLALDYVGRQGHGPFFAPLFRHLRECADPSVLSEPMRQLLDSERINSRSDDDKTLVLALREPEA